MPGPTQSYQYKSGDDPVTLAEQYGITPAELLAANPGGAPFTVGQSIRIPQSRDAYLQQIQANRLGQQQAIGNAVSGFVDLFRNDPYRGYGPNAPRGQVRQYPLYANNAAPGPISPQYPLYAGNTVTPHNAYPMYAAGVYGMQNTQVDRINAMRGRGYGQTGPARPMTMGNWVEPQPVNPYTEMYYSGSKPSGSGTDDSWAFPAGTNTTPAGAPAYNPGQPQTGNSWQTNPALYQLTWNKNAKNRKSTFNTSLRWAENAWRRKAGRGKNRKAEQEQRVQDFALGNSLINFSVSSG